MRVSVNIEPETAQLIQRFHNGRVREAQSKFVQKAFVKFRKPSYSSSLIIILRAGLAVSKKQGSSAENPFAPK